MDNIPFIVVIPVYNAEKFLRRSVQSVLEQNYPLIQMVIVDDGSVDSSGKLADEYQKKYSNIHVIHQQNSGQIVSRNNGILYAQNHFSDERSYFLFLDADDAFLPGSFSKISNRLTQSGCDMLIFGIEQFHAPSGKLTYNMRGSVEGEISDKAALYKIVLSDYRYNSLCRKAVSARLISQTNYDEFSALRHAEDLIQSMDYYRAAKSVLFVKECFYRYYTNPVSVTHQVSVANYPVDSTARAYTWRFVVDEKVWRQNEMDDYAAFLLGLLEKKIISVASFHTAMEQKTAVFDNMKADSFYKMLLNMPLRHSTIISLFQKGNYAAMIKAIKIKKIKNQLVRR